jgi:hypothetical protein
MTKKKSTTPAPVLTLRPNPHTLGVIPLKENEVSFMCRVRMDRKAEAWWKGLDAAGRGKILMELYDLTTVFDLKR